MRPRVETHSFLALVVLALVQHQGQVAASGSVAEVSQELCGQSLLVSNFNNCDLMLSALRREFKDSIICRIGDQLSLTGAQVKTIQPTLTDAMNYHLKRLTSH